MKNLNLITTLLAILIVLFGCKKETPIPAPATTPTPTPIPTVIIGTQTWTTKNLDVATYRNGDAIPQVQDGIAWSNLTTGAWCYYENTTPYGSIYGKLYNWYAVNDSRGLAPTGYHIPTDAEWTTLATYLGGERVAGRKMKESGTSHWRFDEFTDATNSSGFTGLPGGGFNNMVFSGFGHMNAYGFWWSSSEFNTGNAWSRDLCYAFDSASRNNDSKQNGYSVRCIKD